MKKITLISITLIITMITFLFTISCNKEQTITTGKLTLPRIKDTRKFVINVNIVGVRWYIESGSISWSQTAGQPKVYWCEGWWGICQSSSPIIANPTDDPNEVYQFASDSAGTVILIMDDRLMALTQNGELAISHDVTISSTVASALQISAGFTIPAGIYPVHAESNGNYIIVRE